MPRDDEKGTSPQVVQDELDRFIKLLFQGSEAYRLALKLYAGRYEVIVGKATKDILREAIEKHMPDKSQYPKRVRPRDKPMNERVGPYSSHGPQPSTEPKNVISIHSGH